MPTERRFRRLGKSAFYVVKVFGLMADDASFECDARVK